MSTELLEKYDSAPEKPSVRSYIKRSKQEMILSGLVPFPDQELYFDSLSRNMGVILTGRSGAGKRTLLEVFADEGFARKEGDGKPYEHFINAPAAGFAAMGDEDGSAELCELFEELKLYCEGAPDDQIEFCLVSLGDIAPIVKSERLTAALSKGMLELMKNGTGVCTVTAVFDGEAADLPAELRRSFLICKVDCPETQERIDFFESRMAPMKSFVNNAAGTDTMAECTEGMSFEELEGIMLMLQIYLKTKYVNEEGSGTDLTDLAFTKVSFDADEFSSIAENYKTAVKAQDVNISAVAEALSGLPQAVAEAAEEVIPEKPVSPFDIIFDDDDPDAL